MYAAPLALVMYAMFGRSRLMVFAGAGLLGAGRHRQLEQVVGGPGGGRQVADMANIMLAGLALLTVAFLAPAFQWLPEAALAAIVINAMSGSANPRELRVLWRVDRIDFIFGLTTLLVVLAFNLVPAMITGVLSIVYMVYRISFPARSVLGVDPDTGEYVIKHWLYRGRSGNSHQDAPVTAGLVVYRFAAPLVFASAEAFSKTGEQLLIDAADRNELPKALVIDFEEVFEVDSTGAAAVTTLSDYTRRYDVELHLARVHSTAREFLQIAGVVDAIGSQRIHDTIHDAVASVSSESTEAADA